MRKSIKKFFNEFKNLDGKGRFMLLTDKIFDFLNYFKHIGNFLNRFNSVQVAFIVGMFAFAALFQFSSSWILSIMDLKEFSFIDPLVTLIITGFILNLLISMEEGPDPKGKAPIPEDEEETEFDLPSQNEQPDNVIKFKKTG